MDEDQRAGAPGPGQAAVPPAEPVSERMQALLSGAVEDQLGEQRQVSVVLAELRAQVGALGDALRGAASGAGLDRLGTELGTQTLEVRRTIAALGERLDGLSRRLEEVSTSTATGSQGAEHVGVRVTALASDIAGHGAAVEELAAAVQAFPRALAALQRDLAGLHDRVSPLAALRDEVTQLSAQPGGDALRPELDALREQVSGLATVPHIEHVRESVEIGRAHV